MGAARVPAAKEAGAAGSGDASIGTAAGVTSTLGATQPLSRVSQDAGAGAAGLGANGADSGNSADGVAGAGSGVGVGPGVGVAAGASVGDGAFFLKKLNMEGVWSNEEGGETDGVPNRVSTFRVAP